METITNKQTCQEKGKEGKEKTKDEGEEEKNRTYKSCRSFLNSPTEK